VEEEARRRRRGGGGERFFFGRTSFKILRGTPNSLEEEEENVNYYKNELKRRTHALRVTPARTCSRDREEP